MSRIYNNYENIKEVKQKMIVKIEELQRELEIVESKLEESKNDFDTPLASKFRIKANELIKSETKTIETLLLPYVTNLDEVSKRYETAYNELHSSVQGDKA